MKYTVIVYLKVNHLSNLFHNYMEYKEQIPKIRKCPENYPYSGIYLIEFSCGGVKIGQSLNIKSRLLNYKAPWIKDIKQIHCYAYTDAKKLESLIIEHFKNNAFTNSEEFFLIDINIIIQFIEKQINYSPIKIRKKPIYKKQWKFYLSRDSKKQRKKFKKKMLKEMKEKRLKLKDVNKDPWN